MSYLALASDYDGTLATNGYVSGETVAALQRWKASGRSLIMVTGRELKELKAIFPELALFDQVVVENGPVIYEPATGQIQCIAPPPPSVFLEQLEAQGVSPIVVGQVIVATWEPHDQTVLDIISALGIDWQVIRNKRAVMVLPNGINKAAGLRHLLLQMELAPNHVVGVGDAENDLDLLQFCGYGVAVANALPVLKKKADFVTQGERGSGVAELIDRLLIASD
ncbi:5-amino-6-(5-phospho-D-ribitylamino)uracil phosphatase YitU [Acaryochloris thomasi RCC1774]|uniref:5-amino-6-(5-phospho-D-ribitylamino)uracil phosphatase YitU n=1 Tax=Acaryochloris thomasi RCC1774 TaxID=1764569 RepID=A0A2W1JGH0_9CYAN|nr:HAD family hydrolase [Acaryochloris thomasi]PZD70735.1 5-amino-6-(5-phospho-D-ribitylamino)uracil phosphatase YitU [Acaryochloris thomasi RCC1774]